VSLTSSESRFTRYAKQGVMLFYRKTGDFMVKNIIEQAIENIRLKSQGDECSVS